MKRPANPEPLDQIERLLKRIRQLEDIITTHRNDAKKINDLAVMIHRLLFALGESRLQQDKIHHQAWALLIRYGLHSTPLHGSDSDE